MIVHWALVMGICIHLYVCNASAHAQTCPRSSWYENEFASHLQIRIASIYVYIVAAADVHVYTYIHRY